MKKNLCSFLILLQLFFCTSDCFAFEISARCAVLYEPQSGRYLYTKNEDVQCGIASTTKILTAITAIEHGNLQDIVTTDKDAAEIEGSSIWLEEGEKLSLENLLYGLLLASGNDASMAIAKHVGTSYENFAFLMNQTAKITGAKNSNFTNPSGLDDENHYSTAADLAKIMAYAEKNECFRKIVSTRTHAIPWSGHEYNRVLTNHNRLLNEYEGCTGGKTGFTKKCGRCLVSSATRDDIHLIAVTLNAPDDWNDHKKLLDYGFSVLRNKVLVSTDEATPNFKVRGGVSSFVKTKHESTFSFPILDDDVVNTKTTWIKNNTAPIYQDAVVGYKTIYLNDEKIGSVNILSDDVCIKKDEINWGKLLKKMIEKLF